MNKMTGRLTIYILLVLTTALSAAAGIRHPGLLFTPEKVEAAKAREYPAGLRPNYECDVWMRVKVAPTGDGWISTKSPSQNRPQ